MNNERFVIAKNIKEFIMALEGFLINYPKKYYELRNRLVYDSYDLLELIYFTNYLSKEERKPVQLKALMRVNLIDFYIEESYRKRIINEKQSANLSNKLWNINKMLYKWIEDEKCTNQ